jgi:hypothetical protein
MTFLDDILGPVTAKEEHFNHIPKPGDQEWLDDVSNSDWYKARSGNPSVGIGTLSIVGGREIRTQEVMYEADPFFEEEEDEEWTEEGVEL